MIELYSNHEKTEMINMRQVLKKKLRFLKHAKMKDIGY